MTKVKICGFTEPNNARDAALAGVDAIGLVFYDKSPRNVDIHSAQKIIEALPPFINRVGLFVNANPSFIDEILCEVPLDTLQFHGDESVLDLLILFSFMVMKVFLIVLNIKCHLSSLYA